MLCNIYAQYEKHNFEMCLKKMLSHILLKYELYGKIVYKCLTQTIHWILSFILSREDIYVTYKVRSTKGTIGTCYKFIWYYVNSSPDKIYLDFPWCAYKIYNIRINTHTYWWLIRNNNIALFIFYFMITIFKSF